MMKWTKQKFFKNYTSEDGKWQITNYHGTWDIFEKVEGKRIYKGCKHTLKDAKEVVEKLNK